MIVRALALAALLAVPAVARAATVRSVVVVASQSVVTPAYGSLQRYASRRWPKWPQAAGMLAPRGVVLATALGAWYRTWYARSGYWNSGGCADAARITVAAAAHPTTQASAAAFLNGLAPGCGLAVASAPGSGDALFDPVPFAGRADPTASQDALRAALGTDPNGIPPDAAPAFARLDALLDCAASACPKIAPLHTAIAVDAATGRAVLNGPIALGASAVDALRAEYAAGMPASQVGWGRLDLDELILLNRIWTLRSQLVDGNPYAARTGGSNLAARVRAALDRADSRFAVFVGRESNVAHVASLLRLSWTLPGDAAGDLPPGGTMVFERDEADRGAKQKTDVVRTYVIAQPWSAMRRAQPGASVAAVRVPVDVAGCDRACPIAAFDALVEHAIDPAFVTQP